MNKDRDNKYLAKCTELGMCEKGRKLWSDKAKLLSFAKLEIDFFIQNHPFSNQELVSFFTRAFLNAHNVYVDQKLAKKIHTNDMLALFIACYGTIYILQPSTYINIIDNSNINVKVLSKGVLTIHIYENSHINLNVAEDCLVFVFVHSGSVRRIKGKKENIIIKNLQ